MVAHTQLRTAPIVAASEYHSNRDEKFRYLPKPRKKKLYDEDDSNVTVIKRIRRQVNMGRKTREPRTLYLVLTGQEPPLNRLPACLLPFHPKRQVVANLPTYLPISQLVASQ